MAQKSHLENTHEPPWDFHSGNLALDFANTIDWPDSDHPKEMLNSYTDLMSWANFYSVLTKEEAKLLTAEAEKNPIAAAKVLEKAIALRDSLLLVFFAVASNEQPKRKDLDKLKEMWGHAVLAAEIVPQDAGFTWSWGQKKNSLEQILYPVSHAAMDLLLSKSLSQVGKCADDRGCGLLFIDTSRNHSRQWCSMEDCGNRAKAQRYYQRSKSKN